MGFPATLASASEALNLNLVYREVGINTFTKFKFSTYETAYKYDIIRDSCVKGLNKRTHTHSFLFLK